MQYGTFGMVKQPVSRCNMAPVVARGVAWWPCAGIIPVVGSAAAPVHLPLRGGPVHSLSVRVWQGLSLPVEVKRLIYLLFRGRLVYAYVANAAEQREVYAARRVLLVVPRSAG